MDLFCGIPILTFLCSMAIAIRMENTDFMRFVFRSSRMTICMLLCMCLQGMAQTTLTEFMHDHPAASKLGSEERVQVSIMWPDSQDASQWRHEEYRVNAEYYYPASVVKWPVLLLALEWIHEQGRGRWTSDAYMVFDTPHSCQSASTQTQQRLNQALATRQSIANDIQRILLVSDNQSFSRLFYLLGPDYIARKLHEKGYDGTEILKAYDGCSAEARKTWPGVTLFDVNGDTLFQRNSRAIITLPRDTTPIPVGRAYMNADGTLSEPLDFAYQNKLPLHEAMRMLHSFLHIDQSSPSLWNIHPSDRAMVLDAMHKFPRESIFSDLRKQKDYPDDYKKFIYYGNHS
ncbi:MAG: serine hydrolase, partial [Flavobacteriales bacterium]